MDPTITADQCRSSSRCSDTASPSPRRSRSHTPRSTFNQLISHRARSFENMIAAAASDEDGARCRATGRRKRDHSWDKKWAEHLERNMAEEGGSVSAAATATAAASSIAGFRARRQPGKINPGVYWENTERSRLPPKSPSQKRKQLSLANGYKSQSQDREVTVLRGPELEQKKKSQSLSRECLDADADPQAAATSIADVPALPPARPFRDSFEEGSASDMSVLPPPPPELTLDAVGLPEAVSPVELDRAASPSVKRRLVVRAEAAASSSAEEQTETKAKSSGDLGRDSKSDEVTTVAAFSSESASGVPRSDSEVVIPVLIDPCLSQEEERKLEQEMQEHQDELERRIRRRGEEGDVRGEEERSRNHRREKEEAEFEGVFRAEPAEIQKEEEEKQQQEAKTAFSASTSQVVHEAKAESSAAEHSYQYQESESIVVSEERRQVASETTLEEELLHWPRPGPAMAPTHSPHHVSSQEPRRPLFFPEQPPKKDSAFSISGMWSHVDLGLVKERSSPWKAEQLHKTWSSGDLVDEGAKRSKEREREAGRKSADVFSGKKMASAAPLTVPQQQCAEPAPAPVVSEPPVTEPSEVPVVPEKSESFTVAAEPDVNPGPDPTLSQEVRVPVQEPMVVCQSAYETGKQDQCPPASSEMIADHLENQLLYENPLPVQSTPQRDQEVPSLPEPEPEPVPEPVVPQASPGPQRKDLSASPNLFQGPVYDALTLTPGSSYNDLSTCCGGSECGSVGSRRPNSSRRKKSSKIAEDIARRAEEFARLERERRKKEELRRQSAEKVEAERRRNMGQINETIRKKLPQKKDKVQVVEQGYLDKKKADQTAPAPPAPSLSDKQRMLDIQADLRRQREEEERRLAQIRLEEEQVRREREAAMDPAAVYKQVERKLHDQRVREERKNRRKQMASGEPSGHDAGLDVVSSTQHPPPSNNVQVLSAPQKQSSSFSSSSGQGDDFVIRRARDTRVNNSNVLLSPSPSSSPSACPAPAPPPPPARDMECETKVLQKITSSGRFPSQQERWAAKQRQQEEERRAREGKIGQSSDRQGNNKASPHTLVQAEIRSSSSSSGPNSHSNPHQSGLRRSSSGGSNISGGSDDSGGSMRASFMAKQSSQEEEKKLQTWMEMQRQQEEMEERMLRQMEREVERQRGKQEEAPPLPPPPAAAAEEEEKPATGAKGPSPPLPPPPPPAELLTQASAVPPPPPPQRAKVRQLQRSDESEAKQAREWEEVQRRQEEQQEAMIRELEREEERKRRQRAEEEREQREQQMEWEMIQRQQEEEQEAMQRQMEKEKALTGHWHDRAAPPKKKSASPPKDTELPLELQVIQRRQEYELEQERRREAQRDAQKTESQKWEEIQRHQEEEQERMLRQMERDLAEARKQEKPPQPQPPRAVAPPQLNMTATVTPGCRKRSPPIQPQASLEQQQADWEAIKRQQEEEEMFAVMQTERDLIRERQMQEQLREARRREDKTPRDSQEREQKTWEELQRLQEEEEERTRLRQERELQRQRSGSQEKKGPAHPRVSPPRVNLAGDHPSLGPNSPRVKQQEEEWQSVKLRQEEEEAALLMRLERDLQRERQQSLTEHRESERLDATDIAWMREEEERLRIQHEHEVHDREVVSQRIKAMSISEEDEAADEAAQIAERDREFERMAQIEERKREIEDELDRERRHLEDLQRAASRPKPRAAEQYEAMVRTAAATSPSPQTKRKGAPSPQFEAHEREREQQLARIKQLKELEQQKLRELEEVRKQNITPTAAGSVPTPVGAALPPRPAPKHPLKSRPSSERDPQSVSESHLDFEEDVFGGYSEGCDDLSIGIDLPAHDQSSRDVTPIPTTGELKSLLKKPEGEGEALPPPPPPVAFDTEEARRAREEASSSSRSCSPKKAVHFSEVNEVQLVSK